MVDLDLGVAPLKRVGLELSIPQHLLLLCSPLRQGSSIAPPHASKLRPGASCLHTRPTLYSSNPVSSVLEYEPLAVNDGGLGQDRGGGLRELQPREGSALLSRFCTTLSKRCGAREA